MYVHSCGTVVVSAFEAFAHLLECAEAGKPVGRLLNGEKYERMQRRVRSRRDTVKDTA